MIYDFTVGSWQENTNGQWEFSQVVDPNGAHRCGVLRVERSDPSQYCPVRERRMDIVEHPDETRQTILTLLASEPFDGIVEVEQGPPVPEDFVPLKIGA